MEAAQAAARETGELDVIEAIDAAVAGDNDVPE
jgi:hypothetical protein